VMLANTDEIDAHLVGENAFLDQVSDDLRLMQRPSVRTVGDVTEGVEPQFDRVSHPAL